MLDIIILGLLVLGILRGLKRGFILQTFHFIGFFIAFFVAVYFYGSLAPHLEMLIPYPRLLEEDWAFFSETLMLENAYYNMIAFAILFFGTKIVTSIVSSMLDFVADLPILNVVNGVLGVVIGFIEQYLIVFIVVFILSLLPIGQIQSLLEGSSIARFMIEQTPVFSEQIKSLWFEHMINS
ncbi:CvpA family protein [Amphibacillus sp. MSJ-3]|uniref:CvpA family protein n=1 Tax=Amphibacillus sp. MSJ-3 TaxID=2841505 RepID=UPI001C0F12EA|nr:CvpA family protein [Amphibacillus sp. MSJ-3]MBU5593627.1 CvpA family protein [Amphibacillus sp. MSJ-3]